MARFADNPCPLRVLDGAASPMHVDVSPLLPGDVVQLVITVTVPVVLGVRSVPALPTGLVVPGMNGGPPPAVDELDVRHVAIERLVIALPAAVAGNVGELLVRVTGGEE